MRNLPRRKDLPRAALKSISPATLTVSAASLYCGIGRTQLYYLWKSGKIKSRLVCGRRLIYRSSLDEFLGITDKKDATTTGRPQHTGVEPTHSV